jgi:hypothetical protein
MISVGRSVVFRKVSKAREHLEVVGVAHAGDVPAVADEPGGHVLAERPGRVPLDRDLVVVVDPAQVGQPEVAGQRCRLARDAFHHAAVAGQGVGVVVEHLEARPVEVGGHPPAGDGHAHAGGDALAQGARGGLDGRRPAVFRMPRALAVELAEALDVVERDREVAEPLVIRVDRLDAGEVQHRTSLPMIVSYLRRASAPPPPNDTAHQTGAGSATPVWCRAWFGHLTQRAVRAPRWPVPNERRRGQSPPGRRPDASSA